MKARAALTNHNTDSQPTTAKTKPGSSLRGQKALLTDFDTKKRKETRIEEGRREIMLLSGCKSATATSSPNGANVKFLQRNQAKRSVKDGETVMCCKNESAEKMLGEWKSIYNQLMDLRGI